MKRRSFLSMAAAPLAVAARQSTALILLTGDERRRIGEAVSKDEALAGALRKGVAFARARGPWSVAWHRPQFAGAKPNDYYSVAPYWWPDPKNPKGPYIRRDGERNPNRFMDNRRDIGEMSEAVLWLGMGAAFLGDAGAAERARTVLSTWFLDPKTRMNPHLEFGQAVIGRNDGRGAGMIETVSLIDVAQGVALLEESGKFDAAIAAGVRRWFADYMKWMTTSEKGRSEMNAGNNHATWWTAQVAAFATLVGDDAAKALAWERYRTHLVPKQVRPDGSCPAEEARTKSLGYSSMNLDGYSMLCRVAQLNGVDLWRFRTAAGTGIEKSFSYLLPYVLRPQTWRKPQIAPYEQDRVIFPGLAGLGLRSAELLAAYRKLPRAQAPRVMLVDLLVRTAEKE